MDMQRPLSPHLQIYRWQSQMVTSVLHRATGVILAGGLLLLLWGVFALACGKEAYVFFNICWSSPLGQVFLFGLSWAIFYHLCNGIRHIIQDIGFGYSVKAFVFSSWVSLIGSIFFTVVLWAYIIFLK